MNPTGLRILKAYALISVIIVFLLVGYISLSVRFSDTNVYLYTAFLLNRGSLLYRDIFFTNLPLFPYLSAVYLKLLFGSISGFYYTATIEAAAIGLLVYLSAHRLSGRFSFSLASTILFLFSSAVLQVSNHQNGVFTASLFLMIGYWFFLSRRPLVTGFFLSLTFLTKAYFLPIIAPFFLYLLLTRRFRQFFLQLLSFSLTTIIVLSPFFIHSFSQLTSSLIGYSLQRENHYRWPSLLVLARRDYLFMIAYIFTLLNYKKSLFFTITFSSFFLFFILYADFRFLYFQMLLPLLSVSFASLLSSLELRSRLSARLLLIFLACLSAFHIYTHLSSYQYFEKIDNFSSLVTTAKASGASSVYGVASFAPALAYATNLPLVGDEVDINEMRFRMGFLDKTLLTQAAITRGSIVVSYGLNYPQNSVFEPVSPDFVDKDLYQNHCRLLSVSPLSTDYPLNILTLSLCGQATVSPVHE